MEKNNAFEDNITLVNDEGKEIEFEQIAGINYKDDFYLILSPIELEGVEDDEAFVFKYTEFEDGDAEYEFIDDEEILNAVFEIYEKLLDEEE